MLPDSHSQRQRLILNMIHHLGPVSRTSLIELTGYRPATVGEIVGELLEKGLVIESGTHSSGQGRKRVMLEIHAQKIWGMGISFSSHHVSFILSQFDGTIKDEFRLPRPDEPNKVSQVETICHHAKTLLKKYPDIFFAGIGICKPLVDPLHYRKHNNSGRDLREPWIQDLLASKLEEVCKLPVQVFSSVTLPAQAEHQFGCARDVDDFIWVELSNGIGTSLFSGGHAVGGADGTAGELGHMVIPTDQPARLCYCGKPGCVEATAAWPALLADIHAALDSNVISSLRGHTQPLTVADIRQALDNGDRMCLYYVQRAAKLLGTAIANSINLINPRLIVLYGFMVELGDAFLQPLEQAMREGAVFTSDNFEIRISTTSERIMPLGAIANIFSTYLQADNYRWVYQLPRKGR